MSAAPAVDPVGDRADPVVPAGQSPADHRATYRRLLRRETHVSRSGSVVVAMLIALALAATAVFAGALVLLDQNVLGVDPRAVVDAALAAPDSLETTIVIGVGAVVALIGLVLLLQGILPQRRPRHVMSSDRLAVVVDDEVLASAAARAARSATRLGDDAAVGTVGRRTVDVVLRPAAGVDVPAVAATEAVEREFAAIDAQPALAARVRVQPTGRVDG